MIQVGNPLEDSRNLLSDEAFASAVTKGRAMGFEEAVAYAWKYEAAGQMKTSLPGRLSVTVELRGTRDFRPLRSAQERAVSAN